MARNRPQSVRDLEARATHQAGVNESLDQGDLYRLTGNLLNPPYLTGRRIGLAQLGVRDDIANALGANPEMQILQRRVDAEIDRVESTGFFAGLARGARSAIRNIVGRAGAHPATYVARAMGGPHEADVQHSIEKSVREMCSCEMLDQQSLQRFLTDLEASANGGNNVDWDIMGIINELVPNVSGRLETDNNAKALLLALWERWQFVDVPAGMTRNQLLLEDLRQMRGSVPASELQRAKEGETPSEAQQNIAQLNEYRRFVFGGVNPENKERIKSPFSELPLLYNQAQLITQKLINFRALTPPAGGGAGRGTDPLVAHRARGDAIEKERDECLMKINQLEAQYRRYMNALLNHCNQNTALDAATHPRLHALFTAGTVRSVPPSVSDVDEIFPVPVTVVPGMPPASIPRAGRAASDFSRHIEHFGNAVAEFNELQQEITNFEENFRGRQSIDDRTMLALLLRENMRRQATANGESISEEALTRRAFAASTLRALEVDNRELYQQANRMIAEGVGDAPSLMNRVLGNTGVTAAEVIDLASESLPAAAAFSELTLDSTVQDVRAIVRANDISKEDIANFTARLEAVMKSPDIDMRDQDWQMQFLIQTLQNLLIEMATETFMEELQNDADLRSGTPGSSMVTLLKRQNQFVEKLLNEQREIVKQEDFVGAWSRAARTKARQALDYLEMQGIDVTSAEGQEYVRENKLEAAVKKHSNSIWWEKLREKAASKVKSYASTAGQWSWNNVLKPAPGAAFKYGIKWPLKTAFWTVPSFALYKGPKALLKGGWWMTKKGVTGTLKAPFWMLDKTVGAVGMGARLAGGTVAYPLAFGYKVATAPKRWLDDLKIGFKYITSQK